MSTTPDPSGLPLVAVHLLELPIAIHAQAQEQSESLQREFQLIASRAADGEPDHPAVEIPSRLLTLISVLATSYGGFTVDQEDALERATAARHRSIDLTFSVPPSAGEAAATLSGMLDAADDYCREGKHLLTMATPPGLVAYRRWYLTEFVNQIAGHPARPWPEYLAAQPAL